MALLCLSSAAVSSAADGGTATIVVQARGGASSSDSNSSTGSYDTDSYDRGRQGAGGHGDDQSDSSSGSEESTATTTNQALLNLADCLAATNSSRHGDREVMRAGCVTQFKNQNSGRESRNPATVNCVEQTLREQPDKPEKLSIKIITNCH